MGRTWPRTKKADMALWFGVVLDFVRRYFGDGVGSLVPEDDVVAAERPAVIVEVEMVAEG